MQIRTATLATGNLCTILNKVWTQNLEIMLEFPAKSFRADFLQFSSQQSKVLFWMATEAPAFNYKHFRNFLEIL